MAKQPIISLRSILEKDLAHGSKSTLIVGKPGSGKTTLLMGIASKLVDGEICIFRGLPTAQEFRYPGELNILAYRCYPKFYKLDGSLDKAIQFKEVKSGFDKLLASCKLGALNVIYFPFNDERGFWVSFARFLVQRSPGRYASNYVSLFIDEVEDLVPFLMPGTMADVRALLTSLRTFRKTLISAYMATQQVQDLHWLVRGKINYNIFLRGAQVPHRTSRVYQSSVDSLPLGMGILSGEFYARFTFGNQPIRRHVIVRQ